MGNVKCRALKQSKLGALRRAKATRRAYRLQARYLNHLEEANDQVEKQLTRKQALFAAWQALTDLASEGGQPPQSEDGSEPAIESAEEAA